MKVVKYWRTEPVNKQDNGIYTVTAGFVSLWSGYHESEEDAIQYILSHLERHCPWVSGEEFEVLPYYIIKNDENKA